MGNNPGKIEKKLKDKPIVVIVGGGYAGVTLAKALDSDMNVLLFDRKSYFFHNMGALRYSIIPEGKGTDKICYSYDHLLKHGHFIQGEVTDIDPSNKNIRVHGHPDVVPFDYLVISTGTSYCFPIKIAEPDSRALSRVFAEFSSVVAGSRKIVIVGGGAVGVELAGELVDQDKTRDVIIVQSGEYMIPSLNNEAFSGEIKRRLENLGVKVITGSRAQIPQEAVAEQGQGGHRYLTGPVDVTLSSGEVIEAVDLVMFTIGAAVNSASYQESGLTIGAQGRLEVGEYLQVNGHERIFAIGDCALADSMMGFAAMGQAKLTAKNIIATEKGKKLAKYKPIGDVMVVPIGITEGASLLPGGRILGRTITGKIKNKAFFETRFRKEVGDAKGVGTLPDNKAQVDVERLAARLKCSKEEAAMIIEQAQFIEHDPEENHT